MITVRTMRRRYIFYIPAEIDADVEPNTQYNDFNKTLRDTKMFALSPIREPHSSVIVLH